MQHIEERTEPAKLEFAPWGTGSVSVNGVTRVDVERPVRAILGRGTTFDLPTGRQVIDVTTLRRRGSAAGSISSGGRPKGRPTGITSNPRVGQRNATTRVLGRRDFPRALRAMIFASAGCQRPALASPSTFSEAQQFKGVDDVRHTLTREPRSARKVKVKVRATWLFPEFPTRPKSTATRLT